MAAKSDIVTGRIPALECLRAKRRQALVLHVLDSAKGLEALLHEAKSVPVHRVAKRELDHLARGVTHQGVVLEAAPLPLLKLDDWLAPRQTGEALVVVLDGVEDPHNFGAIVRSAAACGAGGVLFAKDRAAPLSAAAIKAGAGAFEYIDLIQVPNIARSLRVLRDAAFWVAGLDAEAEQRIWDADLTGRNALVVGSEGKGMRRLVRENCDLLLQIPLSGPITSLNASVSAAIALAECLRQRTHCGG